MLRKLNPFGVVLALCVAYLAVDYAVVHVGGGSIIAPYTAPVVAVIIEETGFEARKQLTPGQLDVLQATDDGSVRSYLDKHAAKTSDGDLLRRFLDKDADVSRDHPQIQEARKAGYKSLPWCNVANGKTGGGFAIVDRNQTLTELKKYGGP